MEGCVDGIEHRELVTVVMFYIGPSGLSVLCAAECSGHY